VKLPKDTIIAPEKLLRYFLVFRAADDKSKFLSSANYTHDNWHVLEQDPRQQILTLDATEVEQTKHGAVYEIRGILQGPNGKSLSIVTIWMAERVTGRTKFITLFPAKEK
jgi:hypothetical protein